MSRISHMRLHVLERDGWRCQRCGFAAVSPRERVAITLDHVVPVSKGGRTRSWNLQALCLNCNAIKGDEDPTPAEIRRADQLRRTS